MCDTICRRYDSVKHTEGKNPVILCLDENRQKYADRNIIVMGHTIEEYVSLLFEKVREAEKSEYTYIIAEGVPIGGIGTTLLSRLIKLSGGVVI